MLSILLSIAVGTAPLQTSIQTGEAQSLLVWRKGAEIYSKFRLGDIPIRDKVALADTFQQLVEKFVAENSSYIDSLGLYKERYREILIGLAGVLSTVSKTEREYDEFPFSKSTAAENGAMITKLGTSRSNVVKSFNSVRKLFSDDIPQAYCDKLSPPAYYLLLSPWLKSEGDPNYLTQVSTFMMPDFDFGSEALISNYFQTKVDAQSSHEDFERAWKDAGSDKEKQTNVLTASGEQLRKFSSSKPGDTLFAIRKRDVGEWLYVKDWKQLSKKIAYFAFLANFKEVDVLVGKEKGVARPVQATLW